MTSRDFCYWVQGAFELAKLETLDVEQTKILKNHLAMVFVHEIDPSFGDKKKQEELTKVHQGPTDSGSIVTRPYRPGDTVFNC